MRASAPMLGAPSTAIDGGEDTWERQDFMDGIHCRSRANRRYKVKARRTLRRIEKRLWMDEI